MSVTLDKALKREVPIEGRSYTLTIEPEGFKLVPKGRRNGIELRWVDLVSGQAALAAALNASLERTSGWEPPAPSPAPAKKPTPSRGRRSPTAARRPRRR